MGKKIRKFLESGNKVLQNKKRIIIGIVGTHKGAGVTYSGILFAMHIKKIFEGSVAFIEFGDNDDLFYIQEKVEACMELKEFSVQGIGFYRGTNICDVADILNESYDYFIFDLGIGFKYKEEFQRCDINIVIGNLTEWKTRYLDDFLEAAGRIKGNERWKYFISLGEKKVTERKALELKKQLQIIPYVSNPFVVNMEVVGLLKDIL